MQPRFFLLGLLTVTATLAQTLPAPQRTAEQVIVTGTYEPLPLEESERSVASYAAAPRRFLSNSSIDLLQLDPSVDVRQRAGANLQTDVSIRGASFGQTLVLLDGLRLNDAQSGHHSMDVPIPYELVDRVEVLRGSGSTLYGSDAVGGVVNYVTRQPEASELLLSGAVGSFGENQQRIATSYVGPRWFQQLAANRLFSTGFIPNRDYRLLSLGFITGVQTRLGQTRLTLAHADKPFGAENFYSTYPSWERTRTWFAGLRQPLGQQTDIAFGYRRHTDLYVLYRDQPQRYTNRHASESVQLQARRWSSLGANAKLHYGAELLHESINSNNLGQYGRTRGAFHASYDVRAWRRLSFTAGAREDIYGSQRGVFSPSLALGVWLPHRWKLRASTSRAFRVPTYTELYYRDPTTQGNPQLQPEQAWSHEAGAAWYPQDQVALQATVFVRNESDGIDYVRANTLEPWRATNFQRLRFTGVETSVQTRWHRQHLLAGYTAIRLNSHASPVLLSRYVANYARQRAQVEWRTQWRDWGLRTQVGVLERLQRDPYTLWDVRLARTVGRVRPYGQLTNLTNTSYQEIQGVVMPGRAWLAGLAITVGGWN